MKLFWLVPLFFLLGCSAGTYEIETEDLPMFKYIIAEAGYLCGDIDSGESAGPGYRGMIFKVRCNAGELTYRVVLTSDIRDACVEPWDTKNPQCE